MDHRGENGDGRDWNEAVNGDLTHGGLEERALVKVRCDGGGHVDQVHEDVDDVQ